jgi:hypothetical protein
MVYLLGGSTCAISTLWTQRIDNWFNDVIKVLIKEDLAQENYQELLILVQKVMNCCANDMRQVEIHQHHQAYYTFKSEQKCDIIILHRC